MSKNISDTEARATARGQEGGGAVPLPPKRPTIIRPSQDGQGSAHVRQAPARPAPPPPMARVGPLPPTPPTSAKAPVTQTQKPLVSSPVATFSKPSEPQSKDINKSKSQGSVRKRPEITVVDARPMSQAGFRDMKAPVMVSSTKPAINAADLPPDSLPPPTSAAANVKPAPSQTPPSVPVSRPDVLRSLLPPDLDKSPASDSRSKIASANLSPKPSRPTILRPAKPKSAVLASENSLENTEISPPPVIPKRSPVMTETSASGDLGDLIPPPKPARLCHSTDHSQKLNKNTTGEAKTPEAHVVPMKPTRASIIRPSLQPKVSEDEGTKVNEAKDGSQEALKQKPSLPRPPLPISRPVAVVAAHSRNIPPADCSEADETGQSGTCPPVPTTRPRFSPTNQMLNESASENGVLLTVVVNKTQCIPGRSKPPLPASRMHVSSLSDGNPAKADPAVLSKPPPLPTSPPTGSKNGGGLSGTLVPSKSPGGTQDADDSFYAVSEPLEDSLNNMTPFTDCLESHPSRPPPPVPKSKPKPVPPSSPMVGRPLPSVPSLSSCESLSSVQGHFYEDVDSVKIQTQVLEKMPPEDSSQTITDLSSRDRNQAGKVHVVDTEDSGSALYAKVNKPKKQSNPQNASEHDIPPDSSGGIVTNPFGISLRTVTAESSPDPQAYLFTQIEDSENKMKRPPVIAAKPKPTVLPKPQLAKHSESGETLSELVATPVEPPTSSESSHESKPSHNAKRPTIIRPPKPSPKLGDSVDGVKSEEAQNMDVQMRESRPAFHSRPLSEMTASGSELRSERPKTVIGLPDRKQKVSETDRCSPPIPKQRRSPGLMPARDVNSSEEKEDGCSPPVSERTGTLTHTFQPPPPCSGGKPSKPAHQPDSIPESVVKSDSESNPSGSSASPPHRPVTKPLPPKEISDDGGAQAVSSLQFPPPIKREEPSSSVEEKIGKPPPRPSGPPARPVSMPPVRPSLPAKEKSSPVTTNMRREMPSRPQPVRPPKDANTSSPPPLPPRPRLSHPLYSYMAGEPHAIALHDYSATQQDELSFQEGDTLVLLKRIDDQWLLGKVGNKEGIFPQNFVTIIHPLLDELPPSAIDDVIDDVFEEASEKKPDLLTGPRCRARFDFEGEGQGDLAFEDGDVIQLLAHCGGDWLKGELSGKTGIFPASFVEIIEDLPEKKDGQDKPRKKGSEVTALFDFSGESGELSFQAGDKICILSKVNEQWLFGQCGGQQGSFPASFVDAVSLDLPFYDPSTSDQVQRDRPQPEKETSSREIEDKPRIFCTAIYSFQKVQQDDLEFMEGDHIEILEKVGEDWYRGSLAGREGIFPSDFVRLDSDAAQQMQTKTGIDQSAGLRGRALFDFNGEADNELTFKAGEKIILGSMVSEGSEWRWGELHGVKGIFPADFVETV